MVGAGSIQEFKELAQQRGGRFHHLVIAAQPQSSTFNPGRRCGRKKSAVLDAVRIAVYRPAAVSYVSFNWKRLSVGLALAAAGVLLLIVGL